MVLGFCRLSPCCCAPISPYEHPELWMSASLPESLLPQPSIHRKSQGFCSRVFRQSASGPMWEPQVLLFSQKCLLEYNLTHSLFLISFPHLGWEDPLEEGMATHSSILAWRIPLDRGAWQATVHGVTKSQTRLSTNKSTLPSQIILFTYLLTCPLFTCCLRNVCSGRPAPVPCSECSVFVTTKALSHIC